MKHLTENILQPGTLVNVDLTIKGSTPLKGSLKDSELLKFSFEHVDLNIRNRFGDHITGLLLQIDSLEINYLVLVEDKKFWIRTKVVTELLSPASTNTNSSRTQT